MAAATSEGVPEVVIVASRDLRLASSVDAGELSQG